MSIDMKGFTDFKVVILAAGKSTRMGFPKLMLAREGVPLITTMIANLSKTGWGNVSVVVSDVELDRFVRFIVPDSDVIFNPTPENGMISSLRLGLDWAGEDSNGVLGWPVDHPLVDIPVLEAIRSRAVSGKVVIPTFNSRRGHPTWWGRSSWEALRSPAADSGARVVLRSYSLTIEEVTVDDKGILHNINTFKEAESLKLERYSFKPDRNG